MMMMMMKMKMWVLPLLVGLCFQSGSPSPVAPTDLRDPEVLKNAKLALNEINADRQEGYIFALNRVHRVRQKGKMTAQALQVIDGRVYFLHIDVLETKCHVLSRKNLTECPIRDIDDVPKYGRCIAVISAYDGRKNVVLHTYKCTIQEVPPMAVTGTCPDCPFSVSLDHPGIQKAVETSLQKFNDVNNLTNYFALLNVTRASMQWVVGPTYFVEFTIQETVCSRETPGVNVSQCSLMDCEFAHKGHCIASSWPSEPPEMGPSIDAAECEIFEPKGKEPKEAKTEGEHGSNVDKEQEHTNQTHKHGHKHLHHHQASNAAHSPPERRVPLGTVQELPPPDLPAPSRAPPSASGCPGKSIHRLYFHEFEI